MTQDADGSAPMLGSQGRDVCEWLGRAMLGEEFDLRLLQSAKAEIERLRLNRYERHCIERVRDIYADEDDVACNEIAAVLDGLLERTK